MTLVIDPTSPTPPFEQLRLQLVESITGGALPVGAKLPTVRKLAEDLGLAPNTVARTYRELERMGLVVTRGRHGTAVKPRESSETARANEAAEEFASRMHQLGISTPYALTLAKAALEKHET